MNPVNRSELVRAMSHVALVTLVSLLSLLFLFAATCPSPPPAPPAPSPGQDAAPSVFDASSGDCDRGCANLLAIGCVSDIKACAGACAQAMHDHFYAPNVPVCWASAPSKATARACGNLTCP